MCAMWTPDGTYDLIVYLSLALSAFITIHLCFTCYFSFIQYIFIVVS